jgi:hypothetical protein
MQYEYPSFYDHSESYISSLVDAHINMKSIPLTEFSSWAASLHAVSALFGSLALPVMTALLCLKPRSWQKCRAGGMTTDAQDIEKVLGAVRRLPMISNDTWLQTSMVYTLESPDIDQWIDLLYAMVQYSAQEGSAYPSNGGENGSTIF